MRVFKIFMLVAVLAIAALFFLNYEKDNLEKSNYDNNKAIGQEWDTHAYSYYDQNSPNHDLDLKFGSFNGYDTFYRLNASREGTITVKYDSSIDKGRFKIVMVSPDHELSRIAEGSGKGSKEVKLAPGESRIKIVGDKATGTVKMTIGAGEGIKVILEGDDFPFAKQ
ncbi:MAG: hypothetical protein ACM3PE_09240 [Deltaproteobacteria bacterium]